MRRNPKMMPSTGLFAIAALALSAQNSALAFLPSFDRQCRRTSDVTALRYRNLPTGGFGTLPTVEQVTTDCWSEQVQHASELVRQLDQLDPIRPTSSQLNAATGACDGTENQIQQLSDLIAAQFSHHDGIRGFMVAYLTGEGGTTPADLEDVPAPVAEAMKRCNLEELATLACMNVVVPTATAVLHDDPVLSANSAKIAERARRILDSLRGSINVSKNCEAVVVAAGGAKDREGFDEALVEFWKVVFDDKNYGEKQKEEIVRQFAHFII